MVEQASPNQPPGEPREDPAGDRSQWMASRLERLRLVESEAERSPALSRRRTLLLAAMGAVALAAIVFGLFRGVSSSTEGSEPAAVVAAASASGPAGPAVPPSGAFVLGGWIRAQRVVNVGSPVSGLVNSLAVSPGTRVKRGERIAELANDHLLAQVEQARATLAMRRASLEELRHGALDEEVEIARARVSEMEAELAKAQTALERQRILGRDGLTSKQEVENAEREAEIAELRLETARQQYELVLRGPREERVSQAAALVREAEASLRVAEAQVEQTLILAPIDGVVVTQHVEVGELVSAGFGGGAQAAVVTLADVSSLTVEVDIPHGDLRRIHLGQEVEVTSDAAAGRVYRGQVAWIGPEANRQKLSVPIEVEILGDTEGLLPGLSATLRFTVPEPAGPGFETTPAAEAPVATPPA